MRYTPRKILNFLVERARRESLRAVVLTFSPHPEKVLGRSQTAMIQTLPQRLEGFRSAGVQAVLVGHLQVEQHHVGLELFDQGLDFLFSRLRFAWHGYPRQGHALGCVQYSGESFQLTS